MITLLIFLLSANSSYFLRLSPGVMSQGLGGASIMLDEGLTAFHNPALVQGTKFNFTLSRWLYSTNLVSLGASYNGYSVGISYLNYGSIQGFNEDGIVTSVFTPYNICVAIARKYGPFGLAIKTFGEKIDSYSLFGICGSISSYIPFDWFSIGAKIDNIGKEFTQKSTIPLIAVLGLKVNLPKNIDIVVESKIPEIEINAGMLYRYQNIKILFGAKYLKPKVSNFSNLDLTSGVMIQIENYEIGYSFVYTEFSTAHQFSITFTP